MNFPQAVFLQLLCIGLVRPQSNFLQVSFSADKDEVEAGEAVTFIVTARRTPGHPSTLQNNEVRSCFHVIYCYLLLTLERDGSVTCLISQTFIEGKM